MPRVKVTVVDADTGRPIPWVFIQLGALQSSTGLDGSAEFEVSPGTYRLAVRHTEYAPLTQDVTVARDTSLRIGLRRITL